MLGNSKELKFERFNDLEEMEQWLRENDVSVLDIQYQKSVVGDEYGPNKHYHVYLVIYKNKS